jgi:hypothetical protein
MRDEPDRQLRRFERDALFAVAALSAGALLVPGGGLAVAVGVLAGGLLTWFSYATARASVDAAVRRRTGRWALVKSFTRYGILAVAAYVILARLRLHPVGVVLGTTALVVAAAAAAVRALRPSGPPRPGS